MQNKIQDNATPQKEDNATKTLQSAAVRLLLVLFIELFMIIIIISIIIIILYLKVCSLAYHFTNTVLQSFCRRSKLHTIEITMRMCHHQLQSSTKS